MTSRRRGGLTSLEGLLGSFDGLRISSARHNVSRVPELDYFVRKLASAGKEGGEQPPQWDLPFAKAGSAAALPDQFSSADDYLSQMQAHTALEFQAACQRGLEEADRAERAFAQQRRPRGEAASLRPVWWEFELKQGKGGASHIFQEGGCSWVISPEQAARLQLRGIVPLNFEQESWSRHLVQVEETDSFHVVLSAREEEDSGQQVLVVLPSVQSRGPCRMRSLGYMGPYLSQYDSAQLLKYQAEMALLPTTTSRLLGQIVRPQRLSGYSSTLLDPYTELQTDTVPINASQRQAVRSLQGGLSIIQGPPGTGKSTTIFHLIDAQVAPDQQVLVTCSRNQAVDSLVEKVSLLEGGILVFGSAARLGPKAQQFTLAARVEDDDGVVAWTERLTDLEEGRDVIKSCENGELSCWECYVALAETMKGWDEESFGASQTSMKGVHAAITNLRNLEVVFDNDDVTAEKIINFLRRHVIDKAESAIQGQILPEARQRAKQEILCDTRTFVCTIDSTARMVSELTELEVSLELDTVIVDEAGCVLECATPLLLRLHPANLVCVGDHLQLQAFTALVDPPRNHCRSLMERAVDAGLPSTLLTEQYRMHPAISAPISAAFYRSQLKAAPGMLAKRPHPDPCLFVDVADGVETLHTGAGYSNEPEAARAVEEAAGAARVLQSLGISRPEVYILTFYNKQRFLIADLLKESQWQLPSACNVQVLSVDACQGDEADAVVLSTVRTASKGQALSRFFNDRRRLNVALSRARHMCIIVGSRRTLRAASTKEPAWSTILQHYSSSLW